MTIAGNRGRLQAVCRPGGPRDGGRSHTPLNNTPKPITASIVVIGSGSAGNTGSTVESGAAASSPVKAHGASGFAGADLPVSPVAGIVMPGME